MPGRLLSVVAVAAVLALTGCSSSGCAAGGSQVLPVSVKSAPGVVLSLQVCIEQTCSPAPGTHPTPTPVRDDASRPISVESVTPDHWRVSIGGRSGRYRMRFRFWAHGEVRGERSTSVEWPDFDPCATSTSPLVPNRLQFAV